MSAFFSCNSCVSWFVSYIAISLATLASAAELRWKFKEGDEHVAKVEQKSEVTSTVGGTSTVITMETGMDLLWQVTGVDEQGTATITQKFQRLRLKLEMPKAGVISYDSGSETKPTGDAKTIAAAVQPLLEAAVKIKLSPRGEIKDVELDDAARQAIEGLAANHSLKALLSKDGLTNILRQTLVVLPEEDVKPGDEWPRTTTLATPLGNMQQTTTSKLLEPDARSPQVARIEQTSKLHLAEPTAAKARPATLKNQHQKGLLLFDNDAGQLRSAEIEQELVTTSMLRDTAIQVRLVSTLKLSLQLK